MKILWWFSFLSLMGYCIYWRIRSRNGKYLFTWRPWTLLFALAIMFYWRDIPSIKKHGFSPTDDNDSLRQFMHENKNSPHNLVEKGVELYRNQDYVWSLLCFDTAIKNFNAPLNQYLPYYIGDLFQVGKDYDAKTKETDLLFLIESDKWMPTENTTKQKMFDDLLYKIDDARVNLPEADREEFTKLSEDVFAVRRKMITP